MPPGYELKKKGHLGRNVGLGCGGLIALIVIVSIAAANGNKGSSNNTANTAADNSPAAVVSVAADSPTPPPAPTVLLDKSGSGSNKTAIFTAPSEWSILYDYDCTNFGSQGNFQVYVYDGQSELKDLPVNALSDKGTDTVFEHNLSGPYYLEINSECKWHVVVKG